MSCAPVTWCDHEPPESAKPSFRFRHALIQEAVYLALLRNDRRALHARAATALEAACECQLPEVATVVGRHYAIAEDTVRAVHFLELGGDHATDAFANDEAIASFREALTVTGLTGGNGSRGTAGYGSGGSAGELDAVWSATDHAVWSATDHAAGWRRITRPGRWHGLGRRYGGRRRHGGRHRPAAGQARQRAVAHRRFDEARTAFQSALALADAGDAHSTRCCGLTCTSGSAAWR